MGIQAHNIVLLLIAPVVLVVLSTRLFDVRSVNGIDTADESVHMLNKRATSLFLGTFTVRAGVISTQARGDDVECRPVLMLRPFSLSS